MRWAVRDLFYARIICFLLHKAQQKVEKEDLCCIPPTPHCVISLHGEFKYGYLDTGNTSFRETKRKHSFHIAYLLLFSFFKKTLDTVVQDILIHLCSKLEGGMVNFLWQLHWVNDAWMVGKMFFLGVSVREYLGESSVWICRLNKERLYHQSWWAFCHLLRAWIQPKGRGRANLHFFLSWDIHLLLSSDIRNSPAFMCVELCVWMCVLRP